MERTIKVTGKGKISVKPDTIRLLIKQESIVGDYLDAIKESADRKAQLTEALSRQGFEKEEIKTLYFNVDTEYESYQAKDRSWKSRFLGYKYTHRMKIEFPADNERLGKVLGALGRCPGEPEFTIQYTVSDPESAKNELLAKAVEDSKAKADVLSSAAGVGLGDIISIDYSWGELEIYSRPMGGDMLKSCCEYDCAEESVDIDIEPDDIDITDTVTVLWAIKQAS